MPLSNIFIHEKINKAVDYLVPETEPHFIILFGSAVRPSGFRQDSDIDIAFFSDRKFTPYEIFMMSQKLAEMLGQDVDLVDLKSASTVFAAQIIGTGKVIYENNKEIRQRFQMRTLKEYAILNEERQCIMDKIKERGYVYEK